MLDPAGARGGPHLRLPRRLARARRRADEVGLRLDRLARAANAAHVDLRLRRDPHARATSTSRTPSARPSSATSRPSRSASSGSSTTSSTSRGSRRGRSRSRSTPIDLGRVRARGGLGPPGHASGGLTASSSRSSPASSPSEPTGRNSGRCSPTCWTTPSATRPKAGRSPCRARRRVDAAEITVSDEGIGIARADQQRIFTKFFRAERERPRARDRPRALPRPRPRHRHGRAHLGRVGRGPGLALHVRAPALRRRARRSDRAGGRGARDARARHRRRGADPAPLPRQPRGRRDGASARRATGPAASTSPAPSGPTSSSST